MLAVVVSMSRSPEASAALPEPSAMFRMTVRWRSWVETAVREFTEPRDSNCPLYTVDTELTPGTAAAANATALLKPPAPADELVMM